LHTELHIYVLDGSNDRARHDRHPQSLR
jgi:hypothetical protein